MDMKIIDELNPDVRAAILAPLAEFNHLFGPQSKSKEVSIALVDSDGKPTGGLLGRTAHDWLFVEFLSVPEHVRGRGLGRMLLEKAEMLALERGCVGAWLDTFTWQACGFYEKIGYSVFGYLEDHPVGKGRYFLRKLLATDGSS